MWLHDAKHARRGAACTSRRCGAVERFRRSALTGQGIQSHASHRHWISTPGCRHAQTVSPNTAAAPCCRYAHAWFRLCGGTHALGFQPHQSPTDAKRTARLIGGTARRIRQQPCIRQRVDTARRHHAKGLVKRTRHGRCATWLPGASEAIQVELGDRRATGRVDVNWLMRPRAGAPHRARAGACRLGCREPASCAHRSGVWGAIPQRLPVLPSVLFLMWLGPTRWVVQEVGVLRVRWAACGPAISCGLLRLRDPSPIRTRAARDFSRSLHSADR